MIDETEGQDATEVDTTQEDVGSSETETEVEVRARKDGWVPREEWRGDPDIWRDADEFVERGENIKEISRERLDTAHSEIERLKTVVNNLGGVISQVSEREYAKAFADIQQRQRAAVRNSDQGAFEAAERDRKLVESSLRGDNPESKPPAEVLAWESKNQWFNKDSAMTRLAIGYLDDVQAEKPGLPLSGQLDEVSNLVRKAYPAKFGESGGRGAPHVEGGGQQRAGTGSGKAADLPPEARAHGKRYVEEGLFKSLGEYAAAYFEQERK
jgi:hypothetical protein